MINVSDYQDYYVYIYLKEDLTPYYVGKGRKSRAFHKHTVPVPKDKRLIVFVSTNLTEIWAFALERKLIRWYGRKDNKTGILLNFTDGGEGTSGYRHKESSKDLIGKAHKGKLVKEETKRKLSQIRSLNPKFGGRKNKGRPSPFKGRKYSQEESEAHSLRQKKRFSTADGHNHIMAMNQKSIESKKMSCKKLLVISPAGNESIWESVGTFATCNNVKERNIYHLVKKYSGTVIPLGRFAGFVFALVCPEDVKGRPILNQEPCHNSVV